MRELYFISCTAERKEETLLFASLQRLGISTYEFVEHNRSGLADGYNAAIERHAGTDHILVLVHDDVTIADVFVKDKLQQALAMFDVVGLVGSARFNPQAPVRDFRWSCWPAKDLSGAVEHIHKSGLTFWSYFGPTPHQCVVLDGLLIAVDMLTIGTVRFDPRFAFHLYDLDFCLSARRAGLVIGTCNVYAQHASQGDYACDAYGLAMLEFREKWATTGGEISTGEVTAERVEGDLPAPSVVPEEPQADVLQAMTWLDEGDEFLELGYADEAVAAYRKALRADPLNREIRKRAGEVVLVDDLLRAAIVEKARKCTPDDAIAAFELANALHEARMKDEAVVAYRQAIAIEPRYIAAINNLGMTLLDQGDVKGALGQFRQATQMDGSIAVSHSNLLYAMHFDPDVTAEKLAEEHAAWARKFAEPFRGEARNHANQRSPGKRLKVGYVSGNFANHPVGRFIVPVLEGHTEAVEVVCYATSKRDDPLTKRARAAADVWVDAEGMSDVVLAEKVRRDRIDILVDLTLHMSGCRLGMFARRPAPVQMSYLAYNSTTGVDAIKWRMTDLRVEPENPFPYVEKPAMLAGCYWCYDIRFAAEHSPAVNGLPAERHGHVTFGCMNNFAKVSDQAIEAWGRILHEVEGSNLIMHAQPGGHREAIWERFAVTGVTRDRVRFFDWLTVEQYYKLHHAIDIALDPFPTVGGTTTCDALWMGVPVVSLVGKLPIGRSGRSILHQVGLGEFSVENEEKYIAAAVELARDWARLGRFRAELRGRVREGLGNKERFAADLEQVYRRVWSEWCAS